LGDILCLLRFLLFFFFFFLSSAKSLSDTFLGDYWTEINETSQEWRMLRTMSRCADYFQNFQNGHCCHGNGQNSNNLQNGNQWNFTGMLSTMSRCADYFRNFQNGCRCHGNGQNAKKKIEKHKNDYSRLLAEQKLMKLDRNSIHI
jgi:hypothetical protein